MHLVIVIIVIIINSTSRWRHMTDVSRKLTRPRFRIYCHIRCANEINWCVSGSRGAEQEALTLDTWAHLHSVTTSR